ncbi:MAG: hypothetical protein WC253_00835 [Sulfurovaceae bacterium]|jgi:hypothetical protein|nr:hypothetical protein [Sulfurovaceae bacterium]
MKIYQIGLMALGMFVLSGCSSQHKLVLNSNPIGAEIVCQGERIGTTPITYYQNEEQAKNFSLSWSDIMSRCSANWVSGYSENLGSAHIEEFPGGLVLTVDRPFGEGYEKDAQYALQIKQTDLQIMSQAIAADAADRQRRSYNYQMQQQNYQLQQMNNNLNGIRYGY